LFDRGALLASGHGASTVFVSERHNFLVAMQETAATQSTAASSTVALPDGGLRRRSPSFSSMNTYNQAAGVPWNSGTHSACSDRLSGTHQGLAEVSCAEDAFADAAAYVDAPDKLQTWPTNSSLMSEEPLDRAGRTASFERVQGQFKAESFAGDRNGNPRLSPPSPPAGTGL